MTRVTQSGKSAPALPELNIAARIMKVCERKQGLNTMLCSRLAASVRVFVIEVLLERRMGIARAACPPIGVEAISLAGA